MRLIREGAEKGVSGGRGTVDIGDMAGCKVNLLRRGLKQACEGLGPKTVIFFVCFCLFFIFSIKIDSQSILFVLTHRVFQIRTAQLSYKSNHKHNNIRLSFFSQIFIWEIWINIFQVDRAVSDSFMFLIL